jgi:hypothetical protein
MQRKLFTALALLATFGTAQSADVDVGVSIGISQPGVYGRIDIGRFPQPQLIVTQPVVIRPVRQRVEPVYLWVPPGHQKNWRKHCHRYNACGTPVYFVDDGWYHSHVMHGHPGKGHGKKHGHGHGRHKHDD